jgi:hypothetical protein
LVGVIVGPAYPSGVSVGDNVPPGVGTLVVILLLSEVGVALPFGVTASVAVAVGGVPVCVGVAVSVVDVPVGVPREKSVGVGAGVLVATFDAGVSDSDVSVATFGAVGVAVASTGSGVAVGVDVSIVDGVTVARAGVVGSRRGVLVGNMTGEGDAVSVGIGAG